MARAALLKFCTARDPENTGQLDRRVFSGLMDRVMQGLGDESCRYAQLSKSYLEQHIDSDADRVYYHCFIDRIFDDLDKSQEALAAPAWKIEDWLGTGECAAILAAAIRQASQGQTSGQLPDAAIFEDVAASGSKQTVLQWLEKGNVLEQLADVIWCKAQCKAQCKAVGSIVSNAVAATGAESRGGRSLLATGMTEAFSTKSEALRSCDEIEADENPEVKPIRSLRSLPGVDLRYNIEGFNAWANQQINGLYGLAWLKVGFIRHLAAKEAKFPTRQEMERMPGTFHWGAPPESAQLYYTAFAFQDTPPMHPDPQGFVLRDLAEVLDQEEADDNDLVFVSWSSYYWFTDNGDYLVDMPANSCVEKRTRDLFRNFNPLVCLAQVRTILLPRMYTGNLAAGGEFLNRVWPMFVVVLSAYCQRLVSLERDYELIRAACDPGRFYPQEQLERLFMDELSVRAETDRTMGFGNLVEALQELEPIESDAAGFARFCEISQIAWLYVSYVKQLESKGGPFPRRQELHPKGFCIGAPPRAARKFIVSHCWEAEVHPNPGGEKLKSLVATLARLNANDTDVVFLDFCSIPQQNKMGHKYGKDEPWPGMAARDATAQPYFQNHQVGYYPPRNQQENKNFSFALWEMGRLYAFKECEVIVIPHLTGLGKDPQDRFPGGDVWGLVNTREYKTRGWCCAEFSIAKACNTIKNLDDYSVQDVLRTRHWPESVQEYAEMMVRTTKPELAGEGLIFDPERGVDFTLRGDRAVVKYNFFKMAVGWR